MAVYNPATSPFVPRQNPDPNGDVGQTYIARKQDLVSQIMTAFRTNLPSNYVSVINGPYYTLQFQALAERLAEFQIAASQVFRDAEYDILRSEYLWQTLGTLVFPTNDVPQIDGDTLYRDFLRGMVRLLLQGATKASVQGGVELLTDDVVTVIERFIAARVPGSEWTNLDTYSFDVLVEGLSSNPFTLAENVRKVLDALRPAHTLYTYANVLREEFPTPLSDDYAWDLTNYHYDDTRKYCGGAEAITGTAGLTLATDAATLTDNARSFEHIKVGATLAIPFGEAASVVFTVVDATTLTFQSTSPALTALTPILSMVGLRNVTTASDFNITGARILSYNTVQLDTDLAQPALTVGDVIQGNYLWRNSPNAGAVRRVVGTRGFRTDDATPRPYSTSPTGLTGTATVVNGAAVDLAQNFALGVDGEVLAFTSGPNAGMAYRLATVLGNNGGPIGTALGPSTAVRPAPSTLLLSARLFPATGQTYQVTVDRLGVQVPQVATAEDVSAQFWA
jgi:hypothetical protein